jgi:hypothetical protein
VGLTQPKEAARFGLLVERDVLLDLLVGVLERLAQPKLPEPLLRYLTPWSVLKRGEVPAPTLLSRSQLVKPYRSLDKRSGPGVEREPRCGLAKGSGRACGIRSSTRQELHATREWLSASIGRVEQPTSPSDAEIDTRPMSNLASDGSRQISVP